MELDDGSGNMDEAHATLRRLLPELRALPVSTHTEEDSRALIIDKVLEQVLGWKPGQTRREVSDDKSRVDYFLSTLGRRCVVEAKRASLPFKIPSTHNHWYKWNGPSLRESTEISEALDQVTDYALRKGCAVACATTGEQWLIFRASRDDGYEIENAWVAAFRSLDELVDSHKAFSLFFRMLAEPSVRSGTFRIPIAEQEGISLTPHRTESKRVLDLSISEGQRQRKRSSLAKVLDPLFEDILQQMGAAGDASLLESCFVETRESKAADDRLARLTTQLVEDIAMIDERKNTGGAFADEVRKSVDSDRVRVVLLLGQNGAGKSTFIDRFFSVALPDDLRKRVVRAKVDLSTADPRIETLSDHLRTRVTTALEAQLFGPNGPTYDELKGSIFYPDYQRLQRGELHPLFKSDRTAFDIEFGRRLEALRADTSKYLAGMIRFCTDSKKQLPVIVLDNADHFEEDFQTRVFLEAQWVSSLGRLLLVIPMRDSTYWRAHETGPLHASPHTALYLPRPPIADVVEKRFQFAISELRSEASGRKSRISSIRGVYVNVKDAVRLFEALSTSVTRDKYMGYTIASLVAGDVRASLKLFRQVVLSPHMDLDGLLMAYLANGEYRLARWDFDRAVILGDWEHFAREHRREIVNLLDSPGRENASPILCMRVLARLYELHSLTETGEHGPERGFEATGKLIQYFELMGVPAEATDAAVARLVYANLAEPYSLGEVAPSFRGESCGTLSKVRLTSAGRLHRKWWLSSMCYLVNMAADVAIHDEDLLKNLYDLFQDRFEHRRARDYQRVKALEKHIVTRTRGYIAQRDRETVTIPSDPRFSSQLRLLSTLGAQTLYE